VRTALRHPGAARPDMTDPDSAAGRRVKRRKGTLLIDGATRVLPLASAAALDA